MDAGQTVPLIVRQSIWIFQSQQKPEQLQYLPQKEGGYPKALLLRFPNQLLIRPNFLDCKQLIAQIFSSRIMHSIKFKYLFDD